MEIIKKLYRFFTDLCSEEVSDSQRFSIYRTNPHFKGNVRKVYSKIERNFNEEESNKKVTFRKFSPESFSQYIGQKKVKNVLLSYIKAILERKIIFPHTLIHGSAGYGKTTLARIISKKLKVNLVEIISSNITNFYELLGKIKECDGGILFLDEIHSLDRDLAERLYTIMEDFTYNGDKIKPFTLLGATTEIGEIIETRKPFIDRFKLILELEDYDVNDLIQITKQYKNQTFIEDYIEGRVYRVIAKNSKFTPRNAIRLLEATIYLGDISQVLDSFNIIKDGYSKKDLKLLEYLNDNGTTGLQAITSYLSTSRVNYLYEIEPYLLKTGLICRTSRGRSITEKGSNFLEHLRLQNNGR